jgi:phospholipid transport system substrate-binding protein
LNKLCATVVFLLLTFSSSVSMAANATGVIQGSLEQLTQIITQGRDGHEQDPQRLYSQVSVVLTSIFDFDAFSMGVMGKKNAAANPELPRLFAQVLKQSLVEIFTDGLVSLGSYTVELRSPAQTRPDRAKVFMQVVTVKGDVHELTYSLALDEQWQVRNVIFDGVNLGLTMRSQFANSVSTLGSVEQAVARWEIDDSE